MEYEFGEATPEQRPGARRVWSEVYRAGEPLPETDVPEPGEVWYVATLGGEVVWAAQVYSAQAYRAPFEVTVPCGQVGGVATLPHARGQGVAARAMQDLNRAMRASGLPLACLYPYRQSFYEKSGYCRSGWRWQIKAPRECIPSARAELRVEQLTPAEIGRVDLCYTALAKGLTGSCPRDEATWRQRLGKKPDAIYAAVGPEGVEGYFWARPTDFWGWVSVGEMAWSTGRGYRTCLSTLRGLCENQQGAIWCEPPDSPYVAHHRDHGAECNLHRGTMFRALDVDALLRALPGDGEPYQFEVEDPEIPENRGPRLVTPGTPTTVMKSEVGAYPMRVEEFTQAWLGSPSVPSLAALGMVPDCEAATQMARHLVPSHVCCMEFF